jgi:hypothetical protein
LDVALLRYYALLSRRRVGGVELPTRLGCPLAWETRYALIKRQNLDRKLYMKAPQPLEEKENDL